MDSKRELADDLSALWDREASGYEEQAKSGEYSTTERKLLALHASVKRSCANQLRLESRKVSRG